MYYGDIYYRKTVSGRRKERGRNEGMEEDSGSEGDGGRKAEEKKRGKRGKGKQFALCIPTARAVVPTHIHMCISY